MSEAPDPQTDVEASDAIFWAAFHAIDLDGLVAAWSEGVPIAAALSCMAPDGMAYVWPPELATNSVIPEKLLADLVEAVTTRIDAAGCRTALSAIPLNRNDQRRALLQAGFRWTSDVWTMRRTLDLVAPPVRKRQRRNLMFLPYEPATAVRFDEVIERTLVDDRRGTFRPTARELRATYGASVDGVKRWSLIVVDGEDVAVVLVTDRPEDRAREIAYLGVVPEARRQGTAFETVASILEEATADGCENVITTAEFENAAAVSLYTQLGFIAIDQRAGYVRQRGVTDESGDRAGSTDLH